MNQGPLIFLGVFFTLASSWVGLILGPQLQFGKQPAVLLKDSGQFYPPARSGFAQQGAEVYRANGCNVCHSQQARQTDLKFSVMLLEGGTNRSAVAKQIVKIRANATETMARNIISGAPAYVEEGLTLEKASAYVKQLNDLGAKTEVNYNTVGPDMTWRWGIRATVAQDYLLDSPPMIGDVRVGPDLANLGTRRANPTWLMWFLYNPHTAGDRVMMPGYPFLFKKQPLKAGLPHSADALRLPPEFVPKGDFEIVPKPEAVALVAYLMSLQSEASLEEAPSPKPLPSPAIADSGVSGAPPKQP